MMNSYSNESVEITNKMQPCNRIYYSKVYWRLNMFRAAYRSSSGALNCICSLWFIYTCGDRPLSRLSGKKCWTFSKLWNNKFCYKIAPCWLFLLIHTTMHGSMNIKFIPIKCTLVQALRLCTGRTAHRGSRGIALLFHDYSTRRGWGVSVTPRPFFTPGKDPVPIVQEAVWAPGLV